MDYIPTFLHSCIPTFLRSYIPTSLHSFSPTSFTLHVRTCADTQRSTARLQRPVTREARRAG